MCTTAARLPNSVAGLAGRLMVAWFFAAVASLGRLCLDYQGTNRLYEKCFTTFGPSKFAV
jgi:hypothetical protein